MVMFCGLRKGSFECGGKRRWELAWREFVECFGWLLKLVERFGSVILVVLVLLLDVVVVVVVVEKQKSVDLRAYIPHSSTSP